MEYQAVEVLDKNNSCWLEADLLDIELNQQKFTVRYKHPKLLYTLLSDIRLSKKSNTIESEDYLQSKYKQIIKRETTLRYTLNFLGKLGS